jgi:hypothetical protein
MKTTWSASKSNRRAREASLALLLFAAHASADANDPARDPSLPQRVVFGTARALAPTEHLDASASARSKVALPTRAKVSYQLRLAAPLIGSPAADEAGNVVVAHGVERVTELDPNGKTRWSLRLGREIAGPPVVLPSGLRLLVTRDGGVFGVSKAGRVVFERALSLAFEHNAPLLAPALDGGLYIADGERLVKLGADGHPLFSLELGNALRGVFEWRGLTLAVTGRGTVLARAVAGSPTRFASLERPVRRVALAGDRLFAIVGERVVVELDLVSKRLSTHIDDPLLTAREFAIVKDRELRVLTQEAILLGTDAEGRERLRSPLDDLRGATALGTLVVDASGASAVTLNGLDLVLVAPDGSVTSVPGTGCSDPLRPTPTGNGRLAIACRSGVLFGVKGEKR